MNRYDFLEGLISIQASMMRKDIKATSLLRFIRQWAINGNHFSCHDFRAQLILLRLAKEGKYPMRVLKANLIEDIIKECISSVDVRISLQHTFGQFDEWQICEHCGDLMLEGFSWYGATYCSDECVCGGEGITTEELDETTDLDNDDCYYTEWA